MQPLRQPITARDKTDNDNVSSEISQSMHSHIDKIIMINDALFMFNILVRLGFVFG